MEKQKSPSRQAGLGATAASSVASHRKRSHWKFLFLFPVQVKVTSLQSKASCLKNMLGLPGLPAPTAGAQVQSLVRELRFQMPCGAAKKMYNVHTLTEKYFTAKKCSPSPEPLGRSNRLTTVTS